MSAGYSSEIEEVLARQRSADLRNVLARIIPTLEQHDTREMDLNGDGLVWIENDTGKHEAPFRTTEAERKQIVSILAGQAGLQFHSLSAVFEGELPEWDTRVTATLDPIGKSVQIMLRRHAAVVYPLSYYVQHRLMTVTQALAFRQAVRGRETITISGSFGSGKTTLANCALSEKARRFPCERMVIMQDTPELKSSHADTMWIFVNKPQERLSDSGKVQYTFGYKSAMKLLARTNAQAVTVGEVRDADAWNGLVRAMNVGLRGIAFTIHANSAEAIPARCESFVEEDGRLVNRKDIARQLSGLFIHMERDEFGKHRVGTMSHFRPFLVNGDYADLEYIL